MKWLCLLAGITAGTLGVTAPTDSIAAFWLFAGMVNLFGYAWLTGEFGEKTK
jgi:hypothetical protein